MPDGDDHYQWFRPIAMTALCWLLAVVLYILVLIAIVRVLRASWSDE